MRMNIDMAKRRADLNRQTYGIQFAVYRDDRGGRLYIRPADDRSRLPELAFLIYRTKV